MTRLGASSPIPAANDSPPWRSPRAAYVHVPFCAHHCCYCDFAVVAGRDDAIDAYIDALTGEFRQMGEPHPVATLFVGGGTPTHPNPRQLERLLSAIRSWLPLQESAEFSIEANPGNLSAEKIRILADHGVTRISLGVQSFRADTLKTLTRDHSVQDVERALQYLKQYIPCVSIDLIFGVPGQSISDWETDLDAAVSLGSSHLSTYGLTYEKGTPLWKARRQEAIRPLDEELELAMYELAMDKLAGAGMEHYEISNFARPGHRCRHNETYWANHAYLGFGLGAARYINGTRQVNTRDLARYLKQATSGQPAMAHSETLDPEERARETMVVQLRRAEGVLRADFLLQTGTELDAVAGAAISRLVELGLLQDDGDSVHLTRRGKCVADSVILQLYQV